MNWLKSLTDTHFNVFALDLTKVVPKIDLAEVPTYIKDNSVLSTNLEQATIAKVSDIAKEGLHFPCVAIPHKKVLNAKHPQIDGKYEVIFGNKRMYWAYAHNYTHISAIRCESIAETMAIKEAINAMDLKAMGIIS